MRTKKNDHGAYVRKIQEGTTSFTQDLLGEIERLHLLVAALEAEREGLTERARDLQETVSANEALRALCASLEAEMNRLHEQAIALRTENERHQKESSRLKTQFEATRAESQRYSARYAEIEQQNSNLANLYVASYRLHGTLERREVIDALQEIIANLVGSEEAGLYEVNATTGDLDLLASFGLPTDWPRTIARGEGHIGRAVAAGEIYVADPAQAAERAPLERELTACVPLSLAGRVIGAIAVFRLLPQKPGIEDVDRELFELLATHAATALYCSGLHAKAQPAETVA